LNENILSSSAIMARDYYNTRSADEFYYHIWGGEDIHIGIYNSGNEDIFTASRRTVKRMTSFINIEHSSCVLDIGSGYAGSARYLAGRFGCNVVALNISGVENERAFIMNQEHGLSDLIEVVEGSFENIPYPAGSFDFVWSQDAILHSGNRPKVIEEVNRVLKPEGEFIFTDIMQTDDCERVPQPILDRICLESLGSPKFYRETGQQFGLEEIRFDSYVSEVTTHYRRVLEELTKREKHLPGGISKKYIHNMKIGLNHWVDACKDGILNWGIFHFRKVNGIKTAINI